MCEMNKEHNKCSFFINIIAMVPQSGRFYFFSAFFLAGFRVMVRKHRVQISTRFPVMYERVH